MRHIIIDGYNVIRADPRLQGLEQVSLEHARDALVRTLASAPRLANDRIVVVFDGAGGARNHAHLQRAGRIEVVYSSRGQSADDVIIGEARSLGRTARVVVVSNDGDVRARCTGWGCEVSGSDNLLRQLPGRTPALQTQDDDEDVSPTLSTVKRGNPRRPSRKKRTREVRF